MVDTPALLDADSLINEAFAENPMFTDDAPPASRTPSETPTSAGPESTPPEQPKAGEGETPGATPDAPSVKTYTADEWKTMEEKFNRSREGQSAATRRAAGLEKETARLKLELQTYQLGLDALGSNPYGVRPEDFAAERAKMEGFARDRWNAREQAEAAQQQQVASADERAQLALKQEAVDVVLVAAEKGVSGLDIPKMIEAHITGDDDLKNLAAITWEPISDERRAAITRQIYDAAKARTIAEVEKIAEAKSAKTEKRETQKQFDRSTLPGQATGGNSVLGDWTSVSDDFNDFFQEHPIS